MKLSKSGLFLALSYLLIAGYFFVKAVTCAAGLFGCSWAWFTLSMPFYIILSPFFGKLSGAGHIAVFIIGSGFYAVVCYQLGLRLEQLIRLIFDSEYTASPTSQI